jgi:hypothetical protein
MKTINIINSNEKVLPSGHFTFSEFRNPKFGGGFDFQIPKPLVLAMEVLREFFDQPWSITSTIRPGDKFGYHIYGQAIDSVPFNRSKWVEVNKTFQTECLNYQKTKLSKLIQGLRNVGITGLGIEKGCIHIDTRPESTCHSKDSYGKYTIFTWVDDGTVLGKSEVIY